MLRALIDGESTGARCRCAEGGADRVCAARTEHVDAASLKFRRIVVKIGSALLVDRATRPEARLARLACRRRRALRSARREVLVVSSGAIALGRTILDLRARALKLEESQAAAAVGQIALARAWSEALRATGMKSGQILLTLGDTEERRRYLNARATISTPAEDGRRAGHQRERHGGDDRNPLRRQ